MTRFPRAITSFVILAQALAPLSVRAELSGPEQKSVELSHQLKGISDSRWLSLAGEHAKDKYDIVRGDTLSGISKRLFGDPNYWPKIWEINNDRVKNPHFIYPGNALLFTPGTATSLPSVEVGPAGESPSSGGTLGTRDTHDNSPDSDGGKVVLSDSSRALTETVNTTASSANEGPGSVFDEKTPRPPNEWKNLPRQKWENISVVTAPTVDKNGFDSRNRAPIKRTTGIEQDFLISCDPLNPVGTITGARKSDKYLDLKSEVTIESAQKLEAGQIYSMLGTPLTLDSDGRKTESYAVSGTVKILGMNDGQYLGEIQDLRGMTERGDVIVPKIPRIQRVKPIPGPAPIEAKIFLDSRTAPNMSAQFKWVYVDRGSSDGVQPGMIFRFFQYQDPNTGTDLTKSNMLVQGDVEIYQSCGGFSLGQIIWSKNVVSNETPAILLTDVQDYYTRLYLNGNATSTQMEKPEKSKDKKDKDGDWLDDLDNGQDMTSEEDQELQQLEKVEDSAAQGENPIVPKLEGEEQLAPPAETSPEGALPPPEEMPLEMDSAGPPPTAGESLPMPPSSSSPPPTSSGGSSGGGEVEL